VNYQLLLEEVKHFVLLFFKNHDDKRFSYHNKAHTQDVVAAVNQIANHYQLNDEDFFIVSTAAWFHDTGYSGGVADHEARSAQIASDFLTQLNVGAAVIDKVKSCIMATRMPQDPANLLERILCDADLFHLGTDEFRRKSKLMRKEAEQLAETDIDKQHWRQKTIDLMESQQYHTDYCRLLLADKKAQNLARLKQREQEAQAAQKPKPPKPEEQVPQAAPIKLLPELPKETLRDEKGHKKEKPEKGVETMFRITASNHQRLSGMADSKAHIMISVNSIIISLVVSLLLRKIESHERQLIPALLLLTVNLIAIVTAILATRPNLPPGTYTQEDMDNRRINLLFFGNFYKMSMDQYMANMHTMMNDKDFLYGSLIRDLYSQGVVLGRKYQLLRISYSVFMYGIVASVLAFVLSVLL